MTKKKHSPAPSTAAVGTSETKEMEELRTINKQLTRKIVQNRKKIERLRLELVSSVPAPDQDDQDIDAVKNLKALNIQLVKQVAESRKEIKMLQSELALLAVDQDIFYNVKCDVSNSVLSSSLFEAAVSRTVEMDEKIKEVASVAADLEELELRKHAILREKENVEMNIERIINDSDSSVMALEQRKKKIMDHEPKRGTKNWKKWICWAAVTSICIISIVWGLKKYN